MDDHTNLVMIYCGLCGGRLPNHKDDCPDTLTSYNEKNPVVRMRHASGLVEVNDRLAAFIYLLARDHVPSGVIDRVIDYEIPQHPTTSFAVTNGWVAKWAEDAANRLRR